MRTVPEPTPRECEELEQRRWRPRPSIDPTIFELLITHEFLEPTRTFELQTRLLHDTLTAAVRDVPYYRRLFERLGLSVPEVASPTRLWKLPLLTRHDIAFLGNDLQACVVPSHETPCKYSESSGTTGDPVKVLHTAGSDRMFSILGQRQYRWFRLRPEADLAAIRFAPHLHRREDGEPYPRGAVFRLASWRYVGPLFETGPEFGCCVSNSPHAHVAWLRRSRPAYLSSYPHALEHLSFETGGVSPVESPEAIVAVGEEVDPSLRTHLERCFGVPVHQAYGLNEIGRVAVRCTCGRYHVHAEHCVVEIVDGYGKECAPGDVGRVVVTALRNPAMPLIRYATDDRAEAVAGPCACGSTLPSFGAIRGRDVLQDSVPPRLLRRARLLRQRIYAFARELPALRQWRIHHRRDDTLHLLVRLGPDGRGSTLQTLEALRALADVSAVVDTPCLPRTRGGKFPWLISDLLAPPGWMLNPIAGESGHADLM